MEIEEILINKPEGAIMPSPSIASEITTYFKVGEWKKAIALCPEFFKSPEATLSASIEVYKAGCELSSRIIESQNIKLGIRITKKLNQLVADLNADYFVQYQCGVLNYVACAYKQNNKLYLAKKYIDRAMMIIEDFKHVSWDKSATFLNMCAIVSAMGKHLEAFQYAKTAVFIAQEALVDIKFSGDSEEIANKAAVLGIAYHNYAVEHEFLGNLPAAIENYQKAFNIVLKNAPLNTEMINKFQESLRLVKRSARTRPSSAKSCTSEKSAKSVASFKTEGGAKSKKISRRVSKPKESASDKEFLSFKNQCKEFLTSNKEWFRLEDKKTSKIMMVQNESRPPVWPKIEKKKPISRVESPIVIVAPVKGVENVRKAVLHHVEIRSSNPLFDDRLGNFERPDVDVEKEVKTSKRPTITSPKESQNIEFFEEFDEVKPPPKYEATALPREPHELRRSFTRQPTLLPLPPQPVEQKTSEFASLLKVISKLQARFRGNLAREKFSLMKNKPLILHKGAKRIQGKLFMVVIKAENNKKIAVVSDGNDSQKIAVSDDLKPAEIFERLDKNDKGFFISKVDKKEKPQLVKSLKMKISGEDCETKFYFDNKTCILTIKSIKYSNSRVFTAEKRNLVFNSKALILRYINDEVQPYLQFADQKLIINKENSVNQREFLVKGYRIWQSKEFDISVNKIFNDEGYGIEVLAKSEDMEDPIVEIFMMDQVINALALFSVQDIDQQPQLILLPMHLQDKRLVIRKLDKKFIEMIYCESSQLQGHEYVLKVFKLQDGLTSYFFAATSKSAPALISLAVTDRHLASMFKIPAKRIKTNMGQIVKTIQIKSNKITLKSLNDDKEANTPEIPQIIKIQATFRGYFTRDQLKLQKSKSSLILRSSLTFSSATVIVNVLKAEDSLLFELLAESSKKSYYLLIPKPKKYLERSSRLFHIRCIIRLIQPEGETYVLPTLKGLLNFQISFLAEDELSESCSPLIKAILHMGIDHVLLARVLHDKSLLVKAVDTTNSHSPHIKFSSLDLTRIIGANEPLQLFNRLKYFEKQIVVSEILEESPLKLVGNDRIIYRTCKNMSGRLYQISLSITEEEEKMVFTIRQGSINTNNKVIEITVKDACAITGFTKGYLIPMADYMIKHMLIIKDNEIVLEDTLAPYDINNAIRKIQGIIRGHIVRTLFKHKFQMKILAKSKKFLKNEQFTIFLYKINNSYAVMALKGMKAYSQVISTRVVEDYLSVADKFLNLKLIPKLKLKTKDNKVVLAGLKTYKSKTSRRGSLITSNEGSIKSNDQSPLISTRSKGSLFNFNLEKQGAIDSLKILKWRAPRTINSLKCILSIYELPDSGLIEVFITTNDSTLCLEVKKDLVTNPAMLASQVTITNNKVSLYSSSLDVVFSDKRYISNKLSELVIFVTEKGYFATAYLPEENKSLNAFLGPEIDPEIVSKCLRIKEVMGQDVLLVSSE